MNRRVLNALNKMLDEAIAGDFKAENYNESELSKIEAKMSRFLSLSKLKKGQMQQEQDKIHALISDISHQTKTPIANMLLYAQLLQEQQDLPEDATALAAQIAAGAAKLNFLVQALVKSSRLESGVIQVLPTAGDARGLIAAAMDACSPAALAKGIQLSFAQPQEPVLAMYDPKWCAEALYNILDNAVKYTPAGGTVEISVTAYELFTRIDIRDTGRGICEDDMPRVFERFWRGRDSAESEGIGIGLYLAREIVSACGGYIKVGSQEGKGSEFSVFLPIAGRDARGAAEI